MVYGGQVGATKDTSPGRRAGRRGVLRAGLSRSGTRLGALGSGSDWGLSFQYPERPGQRDQAPVCSAARAPRTLEMPRTPWEPRRGLESGSIINLLFIYLSIYPSFGYAYLENSDTLYLELSYDPDPAIPLLVIYPKEMKAEN